MPMLLNVNDESFVSLPVSPLPSLYIPQTFSIPTQEKWEFSRIGNHLMLSPHKIKARPPTMSHLAWPAPLSLLGTMLIENHTGVQALSHLEPLQCLFVLSGVLSPEDLPWAKLCGCQPLKLLLSVLGTCIPGFQVASISSCLKHRFLGED